MSKAVVGKAVRRPKPVYVLTPSLVWLIVEGRSYQFPKDTPNYRIIKDAIIKEDWHTVFDAITTDGALEAWAKGKFTVREGQFSYLGEPLPTSLNKRIVAMATQGDDPSSLFNFWKRVRNNPSHRSVNQLFSFLEHANIPLDKDGFVIAYKAVRGDFYDKHTGTISNKPGKRIKFPRNKVSDDPYVTCHEGLHVGALEYAQSFMDKAKGDQLIVVKVDPQHVVSVPVDEKCMKMRVCEYQVMGLYTVPLDDTVLTEPVEITARIVKAEIDKIKAEPTILDVVRTDKPKPKATDKPKAKATADKPKPKATKAVKVAADKPKAKVTADKPETVKATTDKPKTDKAAKKVKVKAINKPKDTQPKPELHTLLDDWTIEELGTLGTDLLRGYAAVHLKMIGASKIPGGKKALLQQIKAVRDRNLHLGG